MNTLFALAALAAASLDEGMWTFDNPPTKQLKAYGFEPTPEWLEHVRLASVRFPGGSGSFVSADGLVMTNHHVALNTLHKLSSAEHDRVKDGFYAKARADEAKTQDLEIDVFVSYEDVTKRVKGAVEAGVKDAVAEEQRKKEMTAIEVESTKKTGLKSTVYATYAGGEYWLYRYKTYTDVRLVFAPEQGIAFYGGDPDNFTYPRYDLDFAFFRVYENDKPAATPHFFKWNAEGPKDGELVFVSGNPGSTGRLNTMAQLEYLRDQSLPRALRMGDRSRKALVEYSKLGTEEDRQAKDLLFGVENSLKAQRGYLDGLLDTHAMDKRAGDEKEFRKRFKADPKLGSEGGDPWDRIAESRKQLVSAAPRIVFSRLVGTLGSRALTIVRYVVETQKPASERLPEYGDDKKLEAMRRQLFSTAPIYPGLEETRLAAGLQESRDELGDDDPFVKLVLGGRPAKQVAAELMAGTKLADPEARKALVEGGAKAVESSKDPLIQLARKIDPILRELRKKSEDQFEAVDRATGAQISAARFALYGRTVPPDANFTLRLSYGVVKGYEEDTTLVPYKTTFYGLYDRANSFDYKAPYDLPARYRERENRIRLSTPVNFVHTCDIIGGNSGSPTLNAKAEVVGLIFDGNIQSLSNNYFYDDRQQRAVSVHTAGILESLKNVYDAKDLAAELTANGG